VNRLLLALLSVVAFVGATEGVLVVNDSIHLTSPTGTNIVYGELCRSPAINMNSLAPQTLCTVPAGKIWYINFIQQKKCSADITAATGTFGASTSTANWDSDKARYMTTTEFMDWRPSVLLARPAYSAGVAFVYDGVSAEAAADTCIFELYGEAE
jgi:hypothetical protein